MLLLRIRPFFPGAFAVYERPPKPDIKLIGPTLKRKKELRTDTQSYSHKIPAPVFVHASCLSSGADPVCFSMTDSYGLAMYAARKAGAIVAGITERRFRDSRRA